MQTKRKAMALLTCCVALLSVALAQDLFITTATGNWDTAAQRCTDEGFGSLYEVLTRADLEKLKTECGPGCRVWLNGRRPPGASPNAANCSNCFVGDDAACTFCVVGMGEYTWQESGLRITETDLFVTEITNNLVGFRAHLADVYLSGLTLNSAGGPENCLEWRGFGGNAPGWINDVICESVNLPSICNPAPLPTDAPTFAAVDMTRCPKCEECDFDPNTCTTLTNTGNNLVFENCAIVPHDMDVQSLRYLRRDTCTLVRAGASVSTLRLFGRDNCVVVEPGAEVDRMQTLFGDACVLSIDECPN